jgi:hypothetical protein
MNHIVFNLRKRSPLALSLWFSVTSQLIAKGLLLAILTALGTPASAQLPRVLAVAQSENTPETNAVAQKLLGQWQAKGATSDEVVTFIFAPQGNLFIVLPTPDGTPVALKAGYQINSIARPMQLDIQLSDREKALTIFEFAANGQLRLQQDVTPGQPRPTAFKSNAMLLSKTSEVTTVPGNIRVLDSETLENSNNQVSQKPEDEAKKYMYALTKVQQAHYQEVGKFATTIEEVSIGLRTETESYRYQILPQENNARSVTIVAVAKNSALPSYTGAVFVTEVNGKTTTVAQICETDKPSTSPPTMPTALVGGSKIQCPAGSRPLQ